VASYQQRVDSWRVDDGRGAAAAAGADDDLESVNLLRDDGLFAHRLSFGFVSCFLVTVFISASVCVCVWVHLSDPLLVNSFGADLIFVFFGTLGFPVQ